MTSRWAERDLTGTVTPTGFTQKRSRLREVGLVPVSSIQT